MRRLANGTQVAAKPTPPAAVGTPGFGTNGNPSAGVQASIFDADTFNIQQEELAAVIEAAGLTLDATGTNVTQLLVALRNMFGGTGLLATNGYMKLPGSVIMQWGNAISTGGVTSILFPTGFPTTCRTINITEMAAGGWQSPPSPTIYGAQEVDRFGFGATAVRIINGSQPAYEAGLSFNWLAIGY
ncbi:MAG: hypothetical protein E7K72_22560 [Roseomonas mucosa]|nr:hypothetical protein [Roseomonas mucosa]